MNHSERLKQYNPPGEIFLKREVSHDLTLYFRINHDQRLVHMIEDGDTHKEVHELRYDPGFVTCLINHCMETLHVRYVEVMCYVADLLFPPINKVQHES